MAVNLTTNVIPAHSNVTGPHWQAYLVAFEAINITLLVITIWVLTCMIVYGTKTGRWTKGPGASSLSSGVIYATCVVATALVIPRLVATEILHHLMNIEHGSERCELMGDMAKGMYAASTYAIYLFLSLRQRLIYKHPYVKERVGKCMNRLSRLFSVLLTVVTLVVLFLYVWPHSYMKAPYGCVFSPNDDDWTFRRAERSIVLAVALTLLQITILCLSIYPAARVRFEVHSKLELPTINDGGTEILPAKRVSLMANFACCDCFLNNDNVFIATSPVQMSIRRTMLSSFIVVVSDVIAVVVDNVAIPMTAPLSMGQTVYDISSLINVFCMLGTFGFGVRVLTLFWPSCPQIQAKERREASVATISDI